jgi:hypothetical protein
MGQTLKTFPAMLLGAVSTCHAAILPKMSLIKKPHTLCTGWVTQLHTPSSMQDIDSHQQSVQ